MSDWKLLSFYTNNSGASHQLETKGNEQVSSDTSMPLAPASQEIFCTGSNISSCVGFLNQELLLLGLPAVMCNNKGLPDPSSLLNRAFDFFRYYQKIYSTKEELENRIQRLSGESDHHKSSAFRILRQQEVLENKLAQETEKLRQLSSRYKVTASKLKAEKDEVKCLQSVMHHKDLQFKHELRKKEKEINKLKDRLHQMLMDKNPDRKVGMDLMNTLQNSEGRRGQWKPGLSKTPFPIKVYNCMSFCSILAQVKFKNKLQEEGRVFAYQQEEDLYQMLVGNYEERHQELVLENTELRDCLLTLQRELSSLLKQTTELSSVQSHSQKLPEQVESSLSSDDQFSEVNDENYLTVAELNEGYYQMPYDMVRREIERAFRFTCERIGRNIKTTWKKKADGSVTSKLSARTPGPGKKESSQELKQLQNQISKYKEIIQQQEELIQQSLQTHSDSLLQESQLWHEKDVLAKEKELFNEEKAHFEEERKLFTETAVRLARERKAVQDEKIKFLKDHFLNITPFKERQGASQLHHKGGSRLLPATPYFSPAPTNKIKTPSTSELFRTLGLSDLQFEKSNSSTPQSTTPGQITLPEAVSSEGLKSAASNLCVNLFGSPSSIASEHSAKSDNR